MTVIFQAKGSGGLKAKKDIVPWTSQILKKICP